MCGYPRVRASLNVVDVTWRRQVRVQVIPSPLASGLRQTCATTSKTCVAEHFAKCHSNQVSHYQLQANTS